MREARDEKAEPLLKAILAVVIALMLAVLTIAGSRKTMRNLSKFALQASFFSWYGAFITYLRTHRARGLES